jgi:putative ABC transport system permease protein
MFSFIEAIRNAIGAVKANRMRSFLTTLGIIIGVASTIAVVSIIQGFSYSINQQFEGLGSHSISVRSFTPRAERLKGRIAKLSIEDFLLIKSKVKGIKRITPQLFSAVGGTNQVFYRGRSHFANVIGSTYAYQDINQLDIDSGRFISLNDNAKRRKVAVIGPDVVDALEIEGNVIGAYIQFAGEWFKIIGVTRKKGKLLGFSQDNFVVIPFSVMEKMNGNLQQQDIFLQIQIKPEYDIEAIKLKIQSLLRKKHQLSAEQDDDFRVETPEQLTAQFNQIIDSLTVILGGIVGISLIVGGIGIMNIMLVSVTERTKEIGILKAIGAKRSDILLQFLIEAVVISLLGGFIGVLLGYGLGVLASIAIPNMPPANVPLWAIGIAFGFSAGVGILFGILPAAKAANLNPIDALRYE